MAYATKANGRWTSHAPNYKWNRPEGDNWPWLVGIIEGEGHPGGHYKKRKDRPDISYQPVVKVCMIDHDTMERVARLLQTNLLGPYKNGKSCKNGSDKSPIWVVYLAGGRAITCMKELYPYMSERRRHQIDGVFLKWGENESRQRSKKVPGGKRVQSA